MRLFKGNIKKIEAYETSDGDIFKYKEDARLHEEFDAFIKSGFELFGTRYSALQIITQWEAFKAKT